MYKCQYLFMSLYRRISRLPVFYSLTTAEAFDTVAVAGEVEAGLGQSLCRHLFCQATATERFQPVPHHRKICKVIRLQFTVLCKF